MRNYAYIMNLVSSEKLKNGSSEISRYKEVALNEFMDQEVADAFIISYAMTNQEMVIVTDEKFEIDVRNKVKIPNVCNLVNVKYISRLDFLRAIKFTL